MAWRRINSRLLFAAMMTGFTILMIRIGSLRNLNPLLLINYAPMKRRKAIKPFMNSQLRKSCHRKAVLHNGYFMTGFWRYWWFVLVHSKTDILCYWIIMLPRNDERQSKHQCHLWTASWENLATEKLCFIIDISWPGFDDIDDSYWFTQKLISSVIDKHIPMKRRKAIKTPVPFMNSQLRRSCHRKAMLHNRYFKNGRQRKNWELFPCIRNSTTKLKAKSMKKNLTANVTKCISINPSYFGIQSSLSCVIKVYRKMNAECLK